MKKPPVFLLSSLSVSFLFLYSTTVTREHLLNPGEWTFIDEVIVIGVFLSFIVLGFVLTSVFDK